MLNGTVAMAVPAAEAGSAAIMDAKPAAKVDANGKVTIIQSETAKETETKTQTTTPAENTDQTGETATAQMEGEAEAQANSTSTETVGSTETGGAEGTTTEGAAGETGGSAAYTADMAKDTGIIDANGNDLNAVDGTGGMGGMDGLGTEVGTSFSITQSVPAMIGITAVVLALSIVAGVVLAKLKIKKGINLYED